MIISIKYYMILFYRSTNFIYLCLPLRPSAIATAAVFQASARGIGYSFQLAITTPRINLIGYGTATAQS